MTANNAQAEAWNGAEGRYFIAERARLERMNKDHVSTLLDAAAITATDALLDIGCGCGETTLRAARTAKDGHALGVDLSALMLAEARELAERDGIRNVDFLEADAQTYSFPDAAFDVAISSFGVMFFDDPLAAFTNIACALRRAGWLAFLCWQQMASNKWLSVPFAAVAAHIPPPELAGAGQPGGFSLADPQRIRGLLTGAGFSEVTIEPVTGPRWMGTNVDDVVGLYTRTPAVQAVMAMAGKDTTTAVLGHLRESLRPYESPQGVMLESAAWLVTARR